MSKYKITRCTKCHARLIYQEKKGVDVLDDSFINGKCNMCDRHYKIELKENLVILEVQ